MEAADSAAGVAAVVDCGSGVPAAPRAAALLLDRNARPPDWRAAPLVMPGMVAEAKKLRTTLSKKRYNELGFEFSLLADYLDGKISRFNLATALVQGEQKYAKRQWRWFKRNKEIHWIKNKTEALNLAKNFQRAMLESNQQ